jgi:hypothetical protein
VIPLPHRKAQRLAEKKRREAEAQRLAEEKRRESVASSRLGDPSTERHSRLNAIISASSPFFSYKRLTGSPHCFAT